MNGKENSQIGHYFMNFGDFLDNNSCGGGGARIVSDIPYSNSNNNNAITTPISDINSMPTGAIAQPRLVSQSLTTKPMFNSPGLSLALVKSTFSLSLSIYIYDYSIYIYAVF